jgi:hypothetical protein
MHETLMYMDDTFMCMDRRVEWMRLLCMTVYMCDFPV